MKNKIFLIMFLFTSYCYAQDIFYIEPNEIIIREKKALEGDAESAHELSVFYEYSYNNLDDLYKYEKAEFWLAIAAENDSDGYYMKELASYLISINPNHNTRGLYWLYKSSEKGYDKAKSAIEKIYYKYNFSFADDSDYTDFDTEKIEVYKEGALRGSSQAALFLANYYKECVDEEQMIYWLRIGAQNGSKECMKKYAEVLSQGSDKNDIIRAEFWGTKSKL